MDDRTTSSDGAPTMRSLLASVYLPTLIFAVGQGAVVPIVALAARDVGASVAVAGLVGAIGLAGAAVVLLRVPEPLHRTTSPIADTTAVG